MAELVATVRRHKQALFALFMIAVVLAVLWVARGALAAFFIGLALAFVLDPGVTALARRGIPRWAGVLLSYAAVVAIIWALLYFALPPITAQARELVEELPQLGTTIGDIERAILEPLKADSRARVLFWTPEQTDQRAHLDNAGAIASGLLGDAVSQDSRVIGDQAVPVEIETWNSGSKPVSAGLAVRAVGGCSEGKESGFQSSMPM